MVGIFIDDEVRGRMNRAARDERAAERFASIGTALIFIVVIGAILFGLWKCSPSRVEAAPPPEPEVQVPAKVTPVPQPTSKPIKVDNVKQYVA